VKKIDIRDVLFLGGLSVLGYGLYIREPWISFVVCGSILMAAGYLMGDRR